MSRGARRAYHTGQPPRCMAGYQARWPYPGANLCSTVGSLLHSPAHSFQQLRDWQPSVNQAKYLPSFIHENAVFTFEGGNRKSAWSDIILHGNKDREKHKAKGGREGELREGKPTHTGRGRSEGPRGLRPLCRRIWEEQPGRGKTQRQGGEAE